MRGANRKRSKIVRKTTAGGRCGSKAGNRDLKANEKYVRPLRFYLDTSVWSALFADRQPDHQHVAREVVDRAGKKAYELYASDVVLAEVNGAPDPLRTSLLSAVEGAAATILETTADVEAFADACVTRGIVPPKYRPDALHIGLAVISGADALLSWNMEHIVKLKTKREVGLLCLELGYRFIQIVTPEEVLGE